MHPNERQWKLPQPIDSLKNAFIISIDQTHFTEIDFGEIDLGEMHFG